MKERARVFPALVIAASLGGAEPPPPTVAVPAKTPIEVELLENLNSRHSRAGEAVRFRITEDVRVGERVVFAAGTPARGRVKLSEESRPNGRAGILQIVIPRLRCADGREIALFGEVTRSGRNRSTASGAAQIAIGPAGFAIHGREAAHFKGERFVVYTRREESVGPASLAPEPASAAGPGIAGVDPASAAGPAPAQPGGGAPQAFEAEPLTIDYRAAKGSLDEVLEIVLPGRERLPDLQPEGVALVRIDDAELPEPVGALRVVEKRRGWVLEFDGWKVVRHLAGSGEGRANRAWLRVGLPGGGEALVQGTLTLRIELE